MPSLVRKNERHEIRRAVRMRCQVFRARDLSLVSEKVVDLSPDGMLVAVERTDLERGEGVFVTFRATELDLWFDTKASVARIVRGRRREDRQRAIGLRFEGLDRVKRLILRGHLRRTPPPVPGRTQRIDWSATIRSIES
jgi:hypothetical protein